MSLGNHSNDEDRLFSVALSENASWVAFSSTMDGLVPGDRDGSEDAFLWNRTSGDVLRLTEPQIPGGSERNDTCFSFCGHVAITPSGSHVAFTTRADDLVSGDENVAHDVFLWERSSKNLVLVSESMEGGPANGESWARRGHSVSDDGRYIVFMSRATDLVEDFETDKEGVTGVYLRDVVAGQTVRLSQRADGTPFRGSVPVIDPSGGWVAFSGEPPATSEYSSAKRVVYLLNVSEGKIQIISAPAGTYLAGTSSWHLAIAPNADVVSFTSSAQLTTTDDDDQLDVYVWRRADEALTLASRIPIGAEGEELVTRSFLSDQGRSLVFWSMPEDSGPGTARLWKAELTID